MVQLNAAAPCRHADESALILPRRPSRFDQMLNRRQRRKFEQKAAKETKANFGGWVFVIVIRHLSNRPLHEIQFFTFCALFAIVSPGFLGLGYSPSSSSARPWSGIEAVCQDGRRIHGESKRRDFRSYHPKYGRGRS